MDVVLLEGRHGTPEPEGLDLYRGEVSGRQYPLRASGCAILAVPLATGEVGAGLWMRWILLRSQTLNSAGGRLPAHSSCLGTALPIDGYSLTVMSTSLTNPRHLVTRCYQRRRGH
ncbi:MAG: hypothetical protein CM15mP74_05570 [Halieaceae bacterium]|nr:MAG: hypothetical protein CM15mP74_05570 [Halieaceae bacterium]